MCVGGRWVSAFQTKEVPQGIFEYSQRAQNVLKYVFNSWFIKTLFFRAQIQFSLSFFRQPATVKNFNLLFFSLKKKITENTSTWIWKLECTQSFDWIVKVKVHLPSLKAYCWICNAVIGSAHFLSFPSFSKITWIWSTNNNVWIHRCILDAAGVLFRLYLLRLIVGSPFSPPYSRPSLFPKVAFTTGSAQNIRRLTQRRWLLPRLFCSHWRIQWG